MNKYLPADGDDDDVDEKAASNGVVVESDSNHNNNNKSSSSSQSTRFKRKPAAATPAAEQELDTAHHVIRICGADNAKLLQEHGISQLSQLRGSPVAVLRDIVGDAEDVDLWPQMAALLADGHVWFDVERLRASRHVRARSPPTRLAPHHSSQDDVQAAPPVTPTASSRGKRANPTSSSKGDSVRNSSAKRSHAAAHVTPSPAPKSARRVTRSATKK